IAQVAASAAIGVAGLFAFRRFPESEPTPLAEDSGRLVRFILQSSAATGIVAMRSTLTPIVLGIVSTVTQVGYFRVAQSPQQGFNAVSAPFRLVLMTEQTRDWERGDRRRVFAGIRRYTLLAAGFAFAPAWPVLFARIKREPPPPVPQPTQPGTLVAARELQA